MAGTKAPGAVTREMILVHTIFRREFGLMPELVQGVVKGDHARVDIVTGHIELIWSTLHHHHQGEDLYLWPALLERCPEEILPVVHRMETHHERIGNLGVELTEGVAAWRSDPSTAHRNMVLGTVRNLRPLLFEHLGMEEAFVLPLIEKHIVAEEWDTMVAYIGGQASPETLPLLFGIAMYEGSPSAIEETLTNVPADVRPAISEAAPRLYGDYAERVYGTRYPPHASAVVPSWGEGSSFE